MSMLPNSSSGRSQTAILRQKHRASRSAFAQRVHFFSGRQILMPFGVLAKTSSATQSGLLNQEPTPRSYWILTETRWNRRRSFPSVTLALGFQKNHLMRFFSLSIESALRGKVLMVTVLV